MRTVFIAWHCPGNGGGPRWGPVARLDYDDRTHTYRLRYVKGARRLPGFQPFPGMENLESVYEWSELPPLLANRLLDPARSDYQRWLRWSGFDPADPPDPLLLLSVTEGQRQTDLIEVFPCPEQDADGCYRTRFFLHGLRWLPAGSLARVDLLETGEKLLLMLDFCNRADPHAVAVRTDTERTLVGYVPRYLAHDVHKLASRCSPESFEVEVCRVNRDAPLQQRVLCQMRACWPEDFRPCSDEEFQPLAADKVPG